jgi:uncharacterized metal-binding protein
VEKANKEFSNPDILQFAHEASVQEGECYINRGMKPYVFHPSKPRIQETCEFAQKMGYKKLGIAFFGGLHNEAFSLTQILEAQGFEIVSVVCKAGGTPKEYTGIKEEEKIHIGDFESMCNPIAQAMILNDEKTDCNISVGLCVGHYMLFIKYVKGPLTVLTVKDRVRAHNPLGAVYAGFYFEKKLAGHKKNGRK